MKWLTVAVVLSLVVSGFWAFAGPHSSEAVDGEEVITYSDITDSDANVRTETMQLSKPIIGEEGEFATVYLDASTSMVAEAGRAGLTWGVRWTIASGTMTPLPARDRTRRWAPSSESEEGTDSSERQRTD